MVENVVNIGEVLAHGIVFDPKNGELLRTIKKIVAQIEMENVESQQRFRDPE